MRPKKVTVTETVTAELITPQRPRRHEHDGERGHHHHGRAAVTDAIAVTNTLIGGLAPALALGGGALAAFASAAHAAHGATTTQHSGTTLLEASTVTAVATLLQPPVSRRDVRRMAMPDPREPAARPPSRCCQPGSTCARCRPAPTR